jgi:excisionase family DNA binding protein
MTVHDLVDVKEAARLTGLDKTTLYKLARKGHLRSFKVMGTALRFERGDLLALIEESPRGQSTVGARLTRTTR